MANVETNNENNFIDISLEANDDDICAICLYPIQCYLKTNCGHTFCSECIKSALDFLDYMSKPTMMLTCPLCMQNVTHFSSIYLDIINKYNNNNNNNNNDNISNNDDDDNISNNSIPYNGYYKNYKRFYKQYLFYIWLFILIQISVHIIIKRLHNC